LSGEGAKGWWERWGTIIATATLAAGLLGGYLARRDYQITTDTETQVRLRTLETSLGQARLQMDRMTAYLLSNYAWNVAVSERMKWPAPPEPKFFLPAGKEILFTPAGAGTYAAEVP
jgi:hypothetical protein